jgi:hypothetical protein
VMLGVRLLKWGAHILALVSIKVTGKR